MPNETSNTPIGNNGPPKEEIKQNLKGLFSASGRFLKELIDLETGMDREGTIVNIKNNKKMIGANAWLLMCSIMIASLGLDLNSPAVIIGAMLISPLMSPILGVGLGIGINDKNTVYISLRHFGVAIAIAIITSTLYFAITPLGTFTPEIQARTSPTLLDAMVAFFGGLAGIISGTRKDKSNAIPGVAIATALMPPLCVTGYSLANMITHWGFIVDGLNHWYIFLNSFYLFFLNATLVAFGTYLIVRLLKFPMKKFANAKEEFRTKSVIFGIGALILVPSFFILASVLKDINRTESIKQFVNKEFNGVVSWNVGKMGTDTMTLFVSTLQPLSYEKTKSLESTLNEKIILDREININVNQSHDYTAAIATLAADHDKLEKRMELSKTGMVERDTQIENLQKELALLTSDSLLEKSLEAELLLLFDGMMEDIDLYKNDGSSDEKSKPNILTITWNINRPKSFDVKAEERLRAMVMQRCHLKSLKIIHEVENKF